MSTRASLIVDVDRVTGEFISGWPRCEQSIQTILTTRLNTRVMREWWGCDFIDIMDKPMVQSTFALGILAAFNAIDNYEPEYEVLTTSFTPAADGSCRATVNGIYLPDQTSKSTSVNLYSSR
jgi:hypothetical protein